MASASLNVCAFKPANEKWRKMKMVWDACLAAGVDPPQEVEEFFDGLPPDNNGVVVERESLEHCGALSKWTEDSRAGFEIDVRKLPKDVTIVRFYNSW